MKLMGNKGEWSEFYAFVKLLSTGRLYSADEKANRMDGIFFPIVKIFRTENEEFEKEYVISSIDGSVEIHWRSEVVRTLSQSALIGIASYLYHSIVAGESRSFAIDESERIMRELSCSKIVAPSTNKADITMQLHDIHTGYNPICGFSIKSELGSSPTLLNASGATNFVFEVIGLDDTQAEMINEINTNKKIMERIEKIFEYGTLKYRRAQNAIFAENLMLIDTYMEDIVAFLLLDYYRNNTRDCKSLIEDIERKNPLEYPREGIYEYKFRKFLCSIALGMMPSKRWDGHDEANGGYVIVKDNGDVVAYHIYNRDAFESYLLNNTKFEKGSTSKHSFAKVYKEADGKKYINLNLQIRFI